MVPRHCELLHPASYIISKAFSSRKHVHSYRRGIALISIIFGSKITKATKPIRLDFIMADSWVAGDLGPWKRLDCVSWLGSTQLRRYSWHHNPDEPTGVGEGPCVTQSQLLLLHFGLAGSLTGHSLRFHEILQNRPFKQDLTSFTP